MFKPFRDSEYQSWLNPGEDFAHLKISIMKLDGSRTNTSIFLSPRLDQILGGAKNMYFPELNREIPLPLYVASVAQNLENKIASIVEHYKMKKLFIATLVAICNRSIVEYDTDSFSKAVLLITVEDYTCLVCVNIGKARST